MEFWLFLCVCRGLLGGHSMAVMLKDRGNSMLWYQDELLEMAKDLGLRLLPAFNTSSGLPYPRVSIQTCTHKTQFYIYFIYCQIHRHCPMQTQPFKWHECKCETFAANFMCTFYLFAVFKYKMFQTVTLICTYTHLSNLTPKMI